MTHTSRYAPKRIEATASDPALEDVEHVVPLLVPQPGGEG
jgi:hypothetical protein